jgi:hypothetical protein
MASAQVEGTVRDIVGRLEGGIDRETNITVPLFLVAAGLSFYVLGWPVNLSWWAAALWGGGGSFLVFCILDTILENRAVAQAVSDFNRHFPADHPDRERARQMLPGLQSRFGAAKKLALALKTAAPPAPSGVTETPSVPQAPSAAVKRRTDERQE